MQKHGDCQMLAALMKAMAFSDRQRPYHALCDY
jgi:hypothetical protein